MTMETQTLVAVMTILGSGFSAYVGVKVALAEVRKDIEYLYEKHRQTEERVEREGAAIQKRLDRLENPFFRTET